MAQAQDVIYTFVFIFIFAIAAITGVFVYGEFSDGMIATGMMAGAPEEALNDTGQVLSGGFLDGTFLIVFVVGCILSLVVLGYGLGAHPIFAVAYILVLLAEVFISIPISNVYYEFTQNAVFASTAAEFTMANYILFNLPMFLFIIGIMIMIIIYGIRSQSSTGGVGI